MDKLEASHMQQHVLISVIINNIIQNLQLLNCKKTIFFPNKKYQHFP